MKKSTLPKPDAEFDPFTFPDLENFVSEVSACHAAEKKPVYDFKRRRFSFSDLWDALDISFSNTYTLKCSNHVVQGFKIFYYIVVVLSLLCIACQFLEFGYGILSSFQFYFFPLALVSFGCVALILTVRVLFELILLSWEETTEKNA